MKFQVGSPASAFSFWKTRVRPGAEHVRLREHRERDAEVRLAELGDLLVRARLLPGDVVGGEAEQDEAVVAPVAVELLEPLELRRVAALRGGVDDEDDLAAVGA